MSVIISTMRTGRERRRHYLASAKVSEFLVVGSSLSTSVQTRLLEHMSRAALKSGACHTYHCASKPSSPLEKFESHG